MINNKPVVLQEMAEVDSILNLYKDATPENPLWTLPVGKDKQKKKQPKEQAQQ